MFYEIVSSSGYSYGLVEAESPEMAIAAYLEEIGEPSDDDAVTEAMAEGMRVIEVDSEDSYFF